MNTNQLKPLYETSNPFRNRPSTSNANAAKKSVNQGGFPTGSYLFMGNGFVPEANTTTHYNHQTRQGNSMALRSNRWTVTAQLNTTLSTNMQVGLNSARRKSKDRVQTANGSMKRIGSSLRTGINGTGLGINNNGPLSTKNLKDDIEFYNPLHTHQRGFTANEYVAKPNHNLKNRATSASLRNNMTNNSNKENKENIVEGNKQHPSQFNNFFATHDNNKENSNKNEIRKNLIPPTLEATVLQDTQVVNRQSIQPPTISNDQNKQDTILSTFQIKRRSNTFKENILKTAPEGRIHSRKSDIQFEHNQQAAPKLSTFASQPSLDHYQMGKQIGQGAYASVRVASHKQSNQKFGIKTYEKIKLNDQMKKKAVQREIAVLRKLDHPNVIKLYELIDTSRQIHLVTDYVNGISLQQYVKQSCNQRKIHEPQCRRLFKQIAEAVEYLHSVNVSHRDIKLDNILLEEKNNMIKVIDFGFSVICSNQKLKVFCGTPSYMAPEIVQKKEYEGKPVDMWALGVLLFAMLTGTFPFRGISESDLYYKIQRGQFSVPDSVPKEAKRLIYKLLDCDYKRRMTARELIKDPWIRCSDLPLTIFENAATVYRGHSLDNRLTVDNDNVNDFHNQAVDHLKQMGYSGKVIDDSLKSNDAKTNNIYIIYKKQIDKNILISATN